MFATIVNIPNGPLQPAWKPPTLRRQASGSTLVAALEFAYGAIRDEYPELPDAVIITGSGETGYGLNWGHFAHDRWADAITKGKRPELFIGGERLATGAVFTMQTLLHEAAHALNYAHDEQGTSRGHRYHNKTFLARAESLGLKYPELGPSPSIGFSAVTITPEGEERWAKAIAALDAAITLSIESGWLTMLLGPGGTGGAGMGGHGISGRGRNRGTGGTNNVKATCECPNPRIIRVSRTVLAGPPITCEACGSKFEER